MEKQLPKTVVFDAVGTLIYPAPGVAAVYTAVGRRTGSKMTEAEVARRFRVVFGEVEARERAGDLRTSESLEVARWRAIVRRVLHDVDDADGCFTELFRHFGRPDAWRVFADVPAVLAELSSLGVKWALASNFDERLFEIARQIEPLREFRHVLVSSQLGYRKPHARFFEAILATLGEQAQQVVYVGDDSHNDRAGARNAGLQGVLLNRNRPVVDGAISSLSELIPSLRYDSASGRLSPG